MLTARASPSMFVLGWVFPTVRLADPCASADMHTRRLLCIVVETQRVVLLRGMGERTHPGSVTTRARTRTTARTTLRTATPRAVVTHDGIRL